MKASRRRLLGLAALGSAGALSGCSRIVQRVTAPPFTGSLPPPSLATPPLLRLLNRVAFGPRPGDPARVERMGAAAYVDEQLHPVAPEEWRFAARLRGIDALHMAGMEMRDLPDYEILSQLQRAAFLSAVYSRHQLRERMADFWSNHFNVYGMKGWAGFFKPADEFGAIRQHALGRFPDLLREMARSPAMLIYLDNASNQKGVPNENYARELMELHTLGVHGGYTQKDVQELARCLTGWTLEDRFARRKGTFRFDVAHHDDRAKTFLGHAIPAGGGVKDGEQALEILSRHPATGRHLSVKLCHYFLGHEDPHWVNEMAAIYAQTGGDIAAMLRPLLLSDDLLNCPPLLKRPFDYMVSALRITNADTDGGKPLQDHLTKMGEPLYGWPMPDGYPDTAAAWTGSLLARWNFSLALGMGQILGSSLPLARWEALSRAHPTGREAFMTEWVLGVKGDEPGAQTLKAALSSLPAPSGKTEVSPLAEPLALCLASPEFQWR